MDWTMENAQAAKKITRSSGSTSTSEQRTLLDVNKGQEEQDEQARKRRGAQQQRKHRNQDGGAV
eukprot:12404804-Heterocapsa_arctica.AAC.1